MDYNKSIKQHNIKTLDKSINMMTLDEIFMEMSSRLSKLDNVDSLDNRTKELISYILEINSEILLGILSSIKNNELKLGLIDLFSNKLSEQELDKLIYDPFLLNQCCYKYLDDDEQAKREDRINNFKIACNRIIVRLFRGKSDIRYMSLNDYRKPLFQFKCNYKEKNRLEKENKEFAMEMVSRVFLNNYERLDIYNFLESQPYLLIEKIYHKLPEEVKYNFIFKYIEGSKIEWLDAKQRESLNKIILGSLPEDILKYKIIENLEDYTDNLFSELKDEVEISFEDIKNYYRRTGRYISSYRSKVGNDIKTAEEFIEELKYIRQEDKLSFIYDTVLTPEELIKVFDSDEISEKTKFAICRLLNNEERKRCYEKLCKNTKDEVIKNDCEISKAVIENSYDKIIDIIKSGKYSYNHLITECDILNFSDEQIKEIYEISNEPELRAYLLNIRRKDNEWLEEIDSKEKKGFILVNRENYSDFIRNAKSANELDSLLTFFDDYRKDVEFDEVVTLYKDMCEKIADFDKYNKKRIDREWEEWIKSYLTIENYFRLLEMDYPESKKITMSSYCIIDDKMDKNELKGYIKRISDIKNMQIRSTLIDRITNRYYSNNKQNAISTFEDIYYELLSDETIEVTKKYMLLSKYMETYAQRNSVYTEEFYKKFMPIFEKINEQANKNEYTEIFDFKPTYIENDGRKINVMQTHNIISCIAHLGSDKVHDKLVDLYNKNNSIKQYMDQALLNEDVIEMLDDELIEFLSRYSVDTSSLSKILKEQDKTDVFIKSYTRLKDIKSFEEEDALKLANFIEKLSAQELELFEDKYIDLIISLSISQKAEERFKNLETDEKQSKFQNYDEKVKEESRTKIHSPLLTTRQALDALGTRCFGLSYEQMKELVDKYTEDLDELFNIYYEKKELTLEEQNELKTLRILRNIKEILNIKDKKVLIDVFDELDKLEEFDNIDYSLSIVLDENIRRIYAKEYKEHIYNLDEKDKLNEKIDGIDIYVPKEFNMLVHVVAAFGDFNLIDEEKSAKEIWKNVKDKQNHILCTSYIGNSHLCYAKPDKENKGNVIFGFSNVGNNSVLMAAPYDIGSATRNIRSDESAKKPRFRIGKNMLKKTRWTHNEVCIERRLENDKETNIEPDYIVCFDEINEESKKVAKDFGVPIVFINTKEIAKAESEKLAAKYKEFYDTINPLLIEEIINLYQTNVNSFRQNNSELIEKYFNASQMNQNFEKLIRIVDKEYELGNKQKALKCYETLSKYLQEEIKLNVKLGIEPEKDFQKNFKLREYNFLMSKKMKEVKNQQSSKVSAINNNPKSNDKVYAVISAAQERSYSNDR